MTKDGYITVLLSGSGVNVDVEAIMLACLDFVLGGAVGCRCVTVNDGQRAVWMGVGSDLIFLCLEQWFRGGGIGWSVLHRTIC